MSVLAQMIAFATGVPPNINEFHLSRNSIIPYQTRVSITCSSRVELWDFTYNFYSPTCALRPVNRITLALPSYRGCWHGISRSFTGNVIILPVEEFYNPQAFITHAVLLGQAFAHCPIFPTAAFRRSMDRVSVPLWLIILSNQPQIIDLRAITCNNLI